VHNISLVLPGTPKERRAFEFFRACTAPELCGYFHDEFWERNILQASFSHPTLRHAIVALGALHESYKAALQTGAKLVDCPDYFAMRQHTKALSNLSKSLSAGSQQTNVALMSCIVFSCFDSLTGEIDSAIMHIRSGLGILRNAAFDDVNSYSRIFTRLGLQATFFLDSGKEECKLDLWELAAGDPCTDLHKFTSVYEARHSFNSIIGSILYFLSSFPMPKPAEAEQNPDSEEVWSDELLRLYKDHEKLIRYRKNSLIFTIPGMSMPGSENSKDALQLYAKSRMEWTISHHHDFLKKLQDWSRKLDAFLLDLNLNLPSRDLQAAALLKVHWLVCTMMIEGTLSPSKFSSSDFNAKFRKIVALCRSLVAAEKETKASQFSMEYGIISPLYFTGVNCRDPDVRRQVLEVLSIPRRECMWDSRVVAFIIERIIALEEEGTRVPSLNRTVSSAPKPGVITAEMLSRSLRQVIETARNELRTLGGYERQTSTDSTGIEGKPESIRWQTLLSQEHIIDTPATLQLKRESRPINLPVLPSQNFSVLGDS
jgi:hypothetical protein